MGSDRIAQNGDAANKIGTYSVAVLAHHHKIPFYIVAPRTTVDMKCPTGNDIPIEERSPEEVQGFQGIATSVKNCGVFNPAFDVTPHELITALVLSDGLFKGSPQSPALGSAKLNNQ